MYLCKQGRFAVYVRDGERQIKAIALSGYGMENDVQESLEAGFQERLVRPINTRQLEHAINRVCGREHRRIGKP